MYIKGNFKRTLWTLLTGSHILLSYFYFLAIAAVVLHEACKAVSPQNGQLSILTCYIAYCSIGISFNIKKFSLSLATSKHFTLTFSCFRLFMVNLNHYFLIRYESVLKIFSTSTTFNMGL